MKCVWVGVQVGVCVCGHGCVCGDFKEHAKIFCHQKCKRENSERPKSKLVRFLDICVEFGL